MTIPGNSQKPFAWGIIGTGAVARDFALDLPHVTDRACFVKAVLGPEGAELQDFVDQFSVPLSYIDMQTFLEEAQVDAVFIAAPAPFRYPYAIRCLQGGVPVLCESLVSLNTSQAATLIEVSRRTGVFFMEGMPLRFLPSLYTILSLLHTHKIGTLISVKASLTGKVATDDGGQGALPEGGAILNFGSYPLFLSLFLLGEPDSIKATGRLTEAGIDEYCSCMLVYPGGQYATVECSQLADIQDEAVITGDKGTITMHQQWQEKCSGISIAIRGDITVNRECEWPGKGLQFEISEVIRCLEAGRSESDLMTHSMSLRMAGATEEIRKQLNVGMPVKM